MKSASKQGDRSKTSAQSLTLYKPAITVLLYADDFPVFKAQLGSAVRILWIHTKWNNSVHDSRFWSLILIWSQHSNSNKANVEASKYKVHKPMADMGFIIRVINIQISVCLRDLMFIYLQMHYTYLLHGFSQHFAHHYLIQEVGELKQVIFLCERTILMKQTSMTS